jgi:hypothetical protein
MKGQIFMKNYLVFKEVPNKGAYVSLNGITKFVDIKSSTYADLKQLAVDFNSTKDLEVRATLTEKFEILLDGKHKTALKQNPNYSVDQFGRLFLKDIPEVIPEALSKFFMVALDGGLDLEPIENFWRNLYLNPLPNVRAQLFAFLEHNGHPITKNGYFLAYKSVQKKPQYDTTTGKLIENKTFDANTGKEVKETVNTDMTFAPFHTGKYGDNIKIGAPVSMPLDECDADPNRTCSSGLHVGSMAYVGDFGSGSNKVVLEVLVNPRHVVAVPNDYNNTKMRVKEYFPIGISNGENLEVFIEEDYMPLDRDSLAEELKEKDEIAKQAVKALEEHLESLKKASGIL